MSNLHSTRRMALGAIAASWMATGSAWAQLKYPAKPVRMIVPFPAGSQSDVIARVVELIAPLYTLLFPRPKGETRRIAADQPNRFVGSGQCGAGIARACSKF